MTPSRRGALRLITGAALAAALPRPSRADAPAPLRFRILRGTSQVGMHVIGFQRSAGTLRVSTTIDLEVKVAFVTVFRFSHRSEESWEDERLVSLKGNTDENGDRYQVNGTLTADGLRIIAPNGATIAPLPVYTTNNLWNPMALDAKNLVDAHHGGIIGIVGRREQQEEIALGGKRVLAVRYRIMSPFLSDVLWYDQSNHWRKSVFDLKGEQLEYQPA